MHSMTGFGKAEVSSQAGKFTVEISSVNNRYREVSVRLPRQFGGLELGLRDVVSAGINRGKVYVHLGFEESDSSPDRYPINEKALRAYHKRLKVLQRDLKLSGDIELRDLLALPEIASTEHNGIDDKAVWPAIKKAAEKALTSMVKMRQKEGTALARDMAKRLQSMKKLTTQIRQDARGQAGKRREKLRTRIADLLESSLPDEKRLEEEIAIMAEKTDVSEEITRLFSHIDQFKGNLKHSDPVGKKINFILQEMNREANTIGSKCSEIEITRRVISLKEEIEKIREQAQNIE